MPAVGSGIRDVMSKTHRPCGISHSVGLGATERVMPVTSLTTSACSYPPPPRWFPPPRVSRSKLHRSAHWEDHTFQRRALLCFLTQWIREKPCSCNKEIKTQFCSRILLTRRWGTIACNHDNLCFGRCPGKFFSQMEERPRRDDQTLGCPEEWRGSV